MTDERFGASALRWWAVASRLLGWSPETFWRATCSELHTALGEPQGSGASAAPSRELMEQLMERDANG